MEPVTVMITGSGAPGAPGVIKSLRDNGERSIRVIGADASSEAVGFKLADARCKLPKHQTLLTLCLKSPRRKK